MIQGITYDLRDLGFREVNRNHWTRGPVTVIIDDHGKWGMYVLGRCEGWGLGIDHLKISLDLHAQKV